MEEDRVIMRGGSVLYSCYAQDPPYPPEAYASFSTAEGDEEGSCVQYEGKIVSVFLGFKQIPIE